MGCRDNWSCSTSSWPGSCLQHTRIQRAHYSVSLQQYWSLIHQLQTCFYLRLHKQSSALKRIPMRHVTGSLCPAACLSERYRLLKLCFSALLWGGDEASAVCGPRFILETSVCMYSIRWKKCVYASGWKWNHYYRTHCCSVRITQLQPTGGDSVCKPNNTTLCMAVWMPFALCFYPQHFTKSTRTFSGNYILPMWVLCKRPRITLCLHALCVCDLLHGAHGSLPSQSEDTRGHYPGESEH